MTIAARHADISTQDIICDNGMPAFLAHPTGGGPFPTVILMHERYGLAKHTRDQAMRSARDGFAVLAPNFFFHHPDQRMLNAGDSRYDMTDPESVELIKVALAAMRLYCRIPECRDQFNRRTHHIYPESTSGQNLSIALRVQIGKAVRELQLFAIDGYRTVGRGCVGGRRQVAPIDRKEPADRSSPPSPAAPGRWCDSRG